MRRNLLAMLALSIFCLPQAIHAQEPAAADASQPKFDKEALEKQFAETLTGATLTGYFTVGGKGLGSPKPEKYTINRAKKLQGDYWLIESRIQYGEHDTTLPLSLEVYWAGDTPVITLTDLPVPGHGTFTARVLIYGDQYAGTWSGGDHGGQLFGVITRPK